MLVDGFADGVAESNDVGCSGVAAVDERKGVAGGDSDVSERKTFGEAGLFEEPRGGELDLVVSGRPVGDLRRVEVESSRDAAEGGLRDYGILEEGTRAATVGLAFDEKHSLAMTDLADRVIDLDGHG